MNRREFLFGRKSDKPVSADESGATAIEYGLIAGLIAVITIPALTRLSRRQRQNYACIKRAMRGVEQTRFCSRKGA